MLAGLGERDVDDRGGGGARLVARHDVQRAALATEGRPGHCTQNTSGYWSNDETGVDIGPTSSTYYEGANKDDFGTIYIANHNVSYYVWGAASAYFGGTYYEYTDFGYLTPRHTRT